MKRFLAVFLVLAMMFSMVACSLGDITGALPSTGSGGNGGNGVKTVKVFFRVTEDGATIIGVSSIEIEKGEKLDWTTVPTASMKGCEFIGWAYDVNGERMLDVASDKFDSDALLYAIFRKEGETNPSDDGDSSVGSDGENEDVADSSTIESGTEDSVVESGTDSSTVESDATTDSSIVDGTDDSTDESEDVDYSTDDSVDVDYSTDESEDVDYSTDESVDVDYSTDESEDVDYSTGDSVDVDTSVENSVGSDKEDDNVDVPDDNEKVYIYYEPGLGMLEDGEWEVELNKGDRYTNHPVPTRGGYTFTGWYLDEECTNQVTNGKRYTDAETILYAGWTKMVRYTVTFISDGKIVKAISIQGGQSYDEYVFAEKEGYTLNGWINGEYSWNPGDVINSDLELYADFTINEYDVRYHNVYEVENPNPDRFTIESLFELVDLEKEGYIFTGWYTDEELTNEISKIVYTREAIDLYAGWVEKTVSPTPPIIEKWSGKTLNILATTWGSPEPGAPWAQAELTVGANDWNSTSGFGYLINSAILRRAADIKETYGVELNWINARGSHIATLLSEAIVSGSQSTKFHIAMPRMLEAQTIVGTNSIYDLAGSRYIDLTKSYYNQASIETYTVHGHTLFAAGDFSFLDEETSYLTYYNMAMTKGIKDFPDLYQMVKDGKWTIDQMTNIAKLITKNTGEPEWTDNDTYGYGTTNLSRFYQYSGIKQVSVDETGYGMEYVISLNDVKVGTLVGKIIEIQNANWARTSWTRGYEAMQNAFEEGRLLFYDEVINKCSYFENQNETFKVGLLPSPKLSESQDTYYTLCSYQSVVMCIPKATPDREMSEYFFEILAYTGQKHIMAAYKENLRTFLHPDTAAESMEIIENYIFSNLSYDPGYMYGWNGLLNSVQNDSYNTGYNNFIASYTGALDTATEIVTEWNKAWFGYSDR